MSKANSCSSSGTQHLQPQVNAEAEFYEIVNDFGNPLEIVREGLSNALDAGASWFRVSFDVMDIEGRARLVIRFLDNGSGMTHGVLMRDFWGLGYSPSRDMKARGQNKHLLGEKGHGTKIYLRSERVTVRTQSSGGAFCSECVQPLSALASGKLHEPTVKPIEKFLKESKTGTEIVIIGYNDNERTQFVQRVVKDYLLWFTKLGSVELLFAESRYRDFRVCLKCLDVSDFETIPFGHVFPDENSDIDKLFKEKDAEAADWYVKRYLWGSHLTQHPEVTYQAVISVEGDEIKRKYNPMIRERKRSDTGRYRVSDRYGVWLCKDFIPIIRVNDWISGFGSGSNALVLLHGFVNCQSLKLTANRGDIANTDPRVLDELKSVVQNLANEVNQELDKKGLYILRDWQETERTIKQEEGDFANRVKSIKSRKTAKLDHMTLVEPRNESELFGLFIRVHAARPDLFDFEPLDYNTSRGVDIIARNKTSNKVSEPEYWYVELKFSLNNKRPFNHAYKFLRYILCWDFEKSIQLGDEFQAVEDSDARVLIKSEDSGRTLYFLDNPKKPKKIEVIRLKELLKQACGVDFETA